MTIKPGLVVDDTLPVVNVVVAILWAAGFNVLRADSGAEAVELSANYVGVIDLLLSDVQMPQMSGFLNWAIFCW